MMLMMGAHVLRAGVQRHIIDLMERGLISCVAVNGAGVIHDFELSLIGATTEDVARYIRRGEFGQWQETGMINAVVQAAAAGDLGLGEAVGRAIVERRHPHADISVLAAGHRLGIPVTAHVSIGCDITHQHAGCDGAAYGETSYRDFLTYVHLLEQVEGGVVMNFGSAVMAPEVFLKGLSMVRNAACAEGRRPQGRFTTLVCDLRPLPESYRDGPQRGQPAYYFRPWKTMLVRGVADGGESFYVQGDHARTVPQLWSAVVGQSPDEEG